MAATTNQAPDAEGPDAGTGSNELESLRAENAALKADNKELKADKEDLKAVKDELKAVKGELKAVKEALKAVEELTATVKELQAQLQQHPKRAAAVRASEKISTATAATAAQQEVLQDTTSEAAKKSSKTANGGASKKASTNTDNADKKTGAITAPAAIHPGLTPSELKKLCMSPSGIRIFSLVNNDDLSKMLINTNQTRTAFNGALLKAAKKSLPEDCNQLAPDNTSSKFFPHLMKAIFPIGPRARFTDQFKKDGFTKEQRRQLHIMSIDIFTTIEELPKPYSEYIVTYVDFVLGKNYLVAFLQELRKSYTDCLLDKFWPMPENFGRFLAMTCEKIIKKNNEIPPTLLCNMYNTVLMILRIFEEHINDGNSNGGISSDVGNDDGDSATMGSQNDGFEKQKENQTKIKQIFDDFIRPAVDMLPPQERLLLGDQIKNNDASAEAGTSKSNETTDKTNPSNKTDVGNGPNHESEEDKPSAPANMEIDFSNKNAQPLTTKAKRTLSPSSGDSVKAASKKVKKSVSHPEPATDGVKNTDTGPTSGVDATDQGDDMREAFLRKWGPGFADKLVPRDKSPIHQAIEGTSNAEDAEDKYYEQIYSEGHVD